MMKSIKSILKSDKERYSVPKRVQDLIPIRRIWSDGIFQIGNQKFCQTFRFTDINYLIASLEEKQKMFLSYSALLSSLDTGATTKITICGHPGSRDSFESTVLMPLRGDERDFFRTEYNQMVLDKGTGANGTMQEKLVTFTVAKPDIIAARKYFTRVGTELSMHLKSLGSSCEALNAEEKLRLLHQFFCPEDAGSFQFDLTDAMRKGHDFKDAICPGSLEKHSDYLRIGNRYARVFYLKDYANYIKDSMVSEITEVSPNLMLSIDIMPVPMDEAVREVEQRLLGVETNITNWQRRQNANNNFSAMIPYDMERQRAEAKDFLNDLSSRDQRMMICVLTMVLTADTKEQLDEDTESLLAAARKNMCQMAVLRYQQLDGLNTVLPIGVRKIDAFRTLTTESLAVLMPFKVQEIQDEGGIYYGQNAVSHNLILINRANLMNQSAMILGVPGSGKSLTTKQMLMFLLLNTDDDIIVCDPEGEYAPLVRAMGDDVSIVRIAAGGKDRLNAMYMVEGYGDLAEDKKDGERIDPIVTKCQFVLSLLEQIAPGEFGIEYKSIVDRCVKLVYEEAEETGKVPTLSLLREKLLEQPEQEAHRVGLALELYTTGSLDIFGGEATVDLNKRAVVFDIHDLGEQLKPTGLLVITDTIMNRATLNWKRGKRTHIFIDEFHVLFSNAYGAAFFDSAWRMFRKRGAYPTAITQNVEYLLDSTQASTMLSNSELIVMLNQAPSDRMRLAELLNISNEQLIYVQNVDPGCGLIRYGAVTVPFVNRFPKDTRMYKLMTTKPGEGTFAGDHAF